MIENVDHLDHNFGNSGVRPEKHVGIEGVIAPAPVVDALDGGVQIADAVTFGERAGTVVDDAGDLRDGSKEPVPGFGVERGVLHDARAESGQAQLHQPDPGAEQDGAPVAGVSPAQRVGAEPVAVEPGSVDGFRGHSHHLRYVDTTIASLYRSGKRQIAGLDPNIGACTWVMMVTSDVDSSVRTWSLVRVSRISHSLVATL